MNNDIIAEVCYADNEYKIAQKWNIRFAKWFGRCNKVFAYSKNDLPKEFLEANARFFRYGRGGGYWVWKPYVIKKALEKIRYGDYLFYCDSGAILIKPVKKLIKVLERDQQDIMVFEVCGNNDKTWTKRDVFVELECDSEEIASTTQRMGTFILLKKSRKSIQFINEYVDYSQRKMIITDEENECGLVNYEGFRENRHDQSVLSILSKKWGLKAYRDPSQWGGFQKKLYKYKSFKYEGEYETYERSTYPTILIHHRNKKCSLRIIAALYYHYCKDYWALTKKYKNKSKLW